MEEFAAFACVGSEVGPFCFACMGKGASVKWRLLLALGRVEWGVPLSAHFFSWRQIHRDRQFCLSIATREAILGSAQHNSLLSETPCMCYRHDMHSFHDYRFLGLSRVFGIFSVDKTRPYNILRPKIYLSYKVFCQIRSNILSPPDFRLYGPDTRISNARPNLASVTPPIEMTETCSIVTDPTRAQNELRD